MKQRGKVFTVVIISVLIISSLTANLLLFYLLPKDDNSLEYSDGWWVGNPEDFGFDLSKLDIAYHWANYQEYMRSVLIVRNGVLVAEWYFNDSAEAWTEYANSPDWVKFALELPKKHEPGEDWSYSTAQTNLLSVILTKATGMSSKVFADMYLFDPLGIEIAYWSQDPQGYYTGGHDTYFTPRDMAKFGLLYLNNGTLDETEIVPEEWVQDSIQNYEYGTRIESRFFYMPVSSAGYGYQWWSFTFSNHFCFMTRGCCGQMIYCIPSLDLVIVTTAQGNVMTPEAYDQISYIDHFIAYQICPSIVN